MNVEFASCMLQYEAYKESETVECLRRLSICSFPHYLLLIWLNIWRFSLNHSTLVHNVILSRWSFHARRTDLLEKLFPLFLYRKWNGKSVEWNLFAFLNKSFKNSSRTSKPKDAYRRHTLTQTMHLLFAFAKKNTATTSDRIGHDGWLPVARENRIFHAIHNWFVTQTINISMFVTHKMQSVLING